METIDWTIRKPNNFWNQKENRIKCLNMIVKKLCIKYLADWYRIKRCQIISIPSGGSFLSYYKGSLKRLLQDLLPNYVWLPWMFTRCPKNLWKSFNNRLFFMENLGKIKGFTNLDDWYKISLQDFIDNGGRELVCDYGNNPANVVMDIFCEYNWLPWKFKRCSWVDINIRQNYVIWLGKIKGFIDLDDWYKISCDDFDNNYGAGFIRYYDYSPIKVVMENFPLHNWDIWKFKRCPRNWWLDKNNQQIYIKWLGNRLNFLKLEDWYQITARHFLDNYGGSLLNIYKGSPVKIIVNIFPYFNWDFKKFILNNYYNGFHSKYAENEDINSRIMTKKRLSFVKKKIQAERRKIIEDI